MEWLKGFFRNAEFSGQGSLIKLVNPEDNYTKKTEFMSATLIVKNKELFVKNDDFDEEQDQINYISFPLNADAQVTHYIISDEETKIECIKWVNVNSRSDSEFFYGFEFENPSLYHNFFSFVSKYIQIDEEGYQDPKIRLKNLKQAQSVLAVTSNTTPSTINKPYIKPEFNPEEEKQARTEVNFKKVALQSLSHLYSADSILFMSPADLYLLGPNLSTPLLADKGIAFLIIRYPEFKVSLELVREDQIVMRILIDSQFYYQVEEDKKFISWVENVNDNERRIWRANILDSLKNLEGVINIAKYEAEKKVLVSDLNEEDQKWVRGEQEEKKSEEPDDSKAMEIELEPREEIIEEDSSEIIDTVQSWKDSKVYAARKGKITLYSDSGNGLEKNSVISLDFDPYQVMLQKQDTSLLFLNKSKPNIVYILDLERSQIVDELKIKDSPLRELCHPTKFSQLENSGIFLGLTDKSLYTIDPRDPNKIVQDYTYSTNIFLSCLSTTEQGHIAVGSDKGDIRLYKEIGKKSTTNFPGLGHPIKSIDTTKDGAWMLATTDTYLMVIQTKLEGELAYTKALARKRKAPKKLQITPADISKYQIANINFTPAKFNVSSNSDENAIITSTGKFVIIWNFGSVKAGNSNDYYIKDLNDNVIKNEFRFGDESAVITHPKSVKIQNSRWNEKNS